MENIEKWILKFVCDWSIKREVVLIDIQIYAIFIKKTPFMLLFFEI